MAQGLEDRPIGIFLGYSFTDTQNPGAMFTGNGSSATPIYGRLHSDGVDLGLYVTQNRWLRWRADATSTGIFSGATYAFGGPEFTARVKCGVFFAHALAGYGEVNGGLFSTSRNGFALGFGGGVDLRLSSRWSLRLIDADYLPSHFTGPEYAVLFGPANPPPVTSWEKNSRITLGPIFKFGTKF